MKNPFLYISETDKTEYLSSRCSLNRAVMAKPPVHGVEDALAGLRFRDIFSTPLFVEEIRRCAERYRLDVGGFSDNELPVMINEGLSSADSRLRQVSESVAQKFGRRLGLLLLTLKTGEKENRAARPEWDDDCWEFWNGLDTVVLTGGLASGMLGRRFKEHIRTVFDMKSERAYNIRLFDNGSYLGMMGLAQRLARDGALTLALDLGHTRFKRSSVRMSQGEISEFYPQDSLPSLHVGQHIEDDSVRFNEALALHRYILRTIVSSYRDASEHGDVDDTILVSIANYVHNGLLDPQHGGFSKLSMLGANYAQLLSEELSSELHREMDVRLVHDSTASAVFFDDLPNAVCVTLGTGFGVGFPDTYLG